jgi:hypothetical protein
LASAGGSSTLSWGPEGGFGVKNIP